MFSPIYIETTFWNVVWQTCKVLVEQYCHANPLLGFTGKKYFFLHAYIYAAPENSKQNLGASIIN